MELIRDRDDLFGYFFHICVFGFSLKFPWNIHIMWGVLQFVTSLYEKIWDVTNCKNSNDKFKGNLRRICLKVGLLERSSQGLSGLVNDMQMSSPSKALYIETSHPSINNLKFSINEGSRGSLNFGWKS